MTKEPLDGGGSADGTGGSPTQPVSQENSTVDSGSGQLSADVLERLKIIEGHVRAIQSDKDKKLDRVVSKQDDFAKQLAKYQELIDRGMSRDDAIWRLDVERKLAMQDGDLDTEAPPDPPLGERKQEANIDTQALLTQLKLKADDPKVVGILRGDNPAQVLMDLGAYAVELQAQSQKRAPNPATLVPAGGGESVVPEDLATVERQLMELQKNPSKNMKEIQRLTPIHKKLLEQAKR